MTTIISLCIFGGGTFPLLQVARFKLFSAAAESQALGVRTTRREICRSGCLAEKVNSYAFGGLVGCERMSRDVQGCRRAVGLKLYSDAQRLLTLRTLRVEDLTLAYSSPPFRTEYQ